MRGLSGGVDHDLERVRVLGEYAVHPLGVTNIDLEALERVAERADQPFSRGLGRRVGPEEARPHVVLEPDHIKARPRQGDARTPSR